MGKKWKNYKKHENDSDNENEDIAKEQIVQFQQEEDDYSSSDESEESINLISELEEKVSQIKSEFSKRFSSKGKKITWLETLETTSPTPIDQTLNVDDDIKREWFFYNIAKENSITGMIQLKKWGEKINRPDDFFSEMLKSDDQMANIKKGIIREQQYIKKFEEKKQKLQNVKFSKTWKDQQNKDKSAFKRKTMEGIENWKKHIKDNPNDYRKIDKFFDGKRKSDSTRRIELVKASSINQRKKDEMIIITLKRSKQNDLER